MKTKDFKVTILCTITDNVDANRRYADFEIRDLVNNEVCFLDDVLLPKTKKEILDICEFRDRLG